MHSYSIDSDIRRKLTAYITILSVVIMLIIGMIFDSFDKTLIPLEINTKTLGILVLKMFTLSITIFGGFYFLFSRYLWKIKIIEKLHRIPNLNGTWTGSFESSKTDENGKNYTGTSKIVIEQTWTKIKVTSYFNLSTSDSHSATLKINGNDGIELSFKYSNKAERSVHPTMMKHEGFNTLRFIESEDKLVGDYFTDKNRHTYGTIMVTKIASGNVI
ncbi:hypothetical protein [Wukongibacter sp. M2B1]|uniref:Cap15 family cyclic dinucleotide receptor domain-containing protein n=1 Tax=Wukongibacter sp. M2B1 TaxID=3088895 RepID=UPI003D7AC9B1